MDLKNRKILVTGGAGFIGSHLCDRLLREGVEVTSFDNLSTGKLSNLEHIKTQIEIIKGDVVDEKAIGKAARNKDIILHMAYPYGAASRDVDKQFVEDGAIGTFNILRAALKNDVKKVVYASTVAVYGLSKSSVQKEDDRTIPFLPYGATKLLGELYCSSFSSVYGLDTASLRYFNVFGPRYAVFDHSALITFLEHALKGRDVIIYGDGAQVRDYTYIDDIVEGTLLAAQKKNTNGAVYNIAKGKGTSIIELAKIIVKTADSKSRIRFAKKEEYRFTSKGLPYGVTKAEGGKFIDERNYTADINFAVKELDYDPKFTIEDGIAKTLEWLKDVQKLR